MAAPAPVEHEEVAMDRVMKDVVAPPMWPLTKEKMLDKKGASRARATDNETQAEREANKDSGHRQRITARHV